MKYLDAFVQKTGSQQSAKLTKPSPGDIQSVEQLAEYFGGRLLSGDELAGADQLAPLERKQLREFGEHIATALLERWHGDDFALWSRAVEYFDNQAKAGWTADMIARCWQILEDRWERARTA